MTIEPTAAGVNRSGRLASTVLGKTLESAAKESVERVGVVLLGQVLSAAIADPTAAVLGSAAKALVGGLFEQTSAVERKLDVLIAEPLDTATAIVHDVLEVRSRDSDERHETNEDLRDALRDLRTAHSYASRLQPEQCLLIRLYQCVVLALMKNRRNYLMRYVADIVALGLERDREAAAIETAASQIELPYSDGNFASAEEFDAHGEEGRAAVLSAMAFANSTVRDKKLRLEEEARQLREEAKQLKLFETFIETLVTNRETLIG